MKIANLLIISVFFVELASWRSVHLPPLKDRRSSLPARLPGNPTGHQTSSAQKKYSSAPVDRERHARQRRRNAEGADRSRQRKEYQLQQDQMQVFRNEARICELEAQANSMISELSAPPPEKPSSSTGHLPSKNPGVKSARLDWFGESF